MLRTTRKAGAFDRLMAALLTVALAGYSVPANTFASTIASGAAEISGMILLPDGLTPVTGVRVKAANLETKQVYSSEKTSQDGVYRLASLPAGAYDLAVETPDGLYASDALVDAVAGKRQVVSLAIRKGAQPGVREGRDEPPKPAEGEPAPEGEKKEEPKKDEPATEPEPEQVKGKKSGQSFWRTPWGAGILIVGGAIVIGYGADAIVGADDEIDLDQMSNTRRSN
mgnify:CR=1 FL=1